MEEKKQRSYKSIYCPLCEKEVSKSTWYSHYSQFFDSRSKVWSKAAESSSSASSCLNDFDFGGSDDESSCTIEHNDGESVVFDEEEPYCTINTAEFIDTVSASQNHSFHLAYFV